MENQENELNLGANEQNIGADEHVGSYLRRIREAQGLELEQLSKAIRLGKKVLQAIEDNQWDFFPAEAYLRSYIASICDKLSLDKHEVLKRFSAETNSHFKVTQKNVISNEEPTQESSSGNTAKIVMLVLIVILVIMFFVFKTLDSSSAEAQPVPVATTSSIEPEPTDAEATEAADSLAKSDSIPVSQVSQTVEIESVSDTLRFECSPSATDNTCGVSHKGVDIKMNYFRNYTYRYVNRRDTAQITITVPSRTRLLMNGSRVDYEKYNTLVFFGGKIISKSNRDLR